MAYNAGPPQGGAPYQQYPSQQNPPYPSQPAPQYPSQPAPQYPSQAAPPYPSQAAPPYPSQAAPQYPSQAAPQHPSQATPPYLDPTASSAPPQIDGYRDIGFDGGFVRPPADPMPSAPPADQPRIAFTQDPLTRDEVKDALAAFVAQHCCYGSAPIKDMQIRNVAPTFTFKVLTPHTRSHPIELGADQERGAAVENDAGERRRPSPPRVTAPATSGTRPAH
ncbi:vegetative cell wall protein gp1-like [Amphibalanus amphitrite]|uniref:vegetative cell wall protein gp1-like n=1 Tax=Amphibalanus amphitrite TaxID=1232801 RepID=UPI001C924431|nr:vegetative cell wall protein gp1-like [Amphibalanus amphitrite]